MESIIKFNGPILSGLSFENKFLISVGGGGKKFGIPNKINLINKESNILNEIDTGEDMITNLTKTKDNLVIGLSDNYIYPIFIDNTEKIIKLEKFKFNDDSEENYKGKISVDGIYYSWFFNNKIKIYKIIFNPKRAKLNLKLIKELELENKIVDFNYSDNNIVITLKNKIFVFNLKNLKKINEINDDNLITSKIISPNKILIISLEKNNIIFNILDLNTKYILISKSFRQKNKISNIYFYKDINIIIGDISGMVKTFKINNTNISFINKSKIHEFPVNSCGILEYNEEKCFSTSSDQKLVIYKLKSNKNLFMFYLLAASILILIISYILKK